MQTSSVKGLTLVHLKKTPAKFMIFTGLSHWRFAERPVKILLGPPVQSFTILVLRNV